MVKKFSFLLLVVLVSTPSPTTSSKQMTKALEKFEQDVIFGDKEKLDGVLKGDKSTLEDALLAAPTSIGILAQLNLIATSREVDLTEGVPFYNYVFLKKPHSFRASLHQLSHAGYQAFIEGHKSMNEIELITKGVKNQTAQALGLLYNPAAFADDVNEFFPIFINDIRNSADECERLAESVTQKFDVVINITQELQLAIIDKQGDSEKKLKVTEDLITIRTQQKKEIERAKRESAIFVQETKMMLEEANNEVDEAIETMKPDDTGLIINAVIGTIASAVSAFGAESKKENPDWFSPITKTIGSISSTILTASEGKGEDDVQNTARAPKYTKPAKRDFQATMANNRLLQNIQKIQNRHVKGMSHFFFENGTFNLANIDDSDHLTRTPKRILLSLEEVIKPAIDDVKDKSNAKYTNQTLKIINEVKALLEKITQAKDQRPKGEDGSAPDVKDLMAEYNTLKEKVDKLATSAQAVLTGTMPFKKNGPLGTFDEGEDPGTTDSTQLSYAYTKLENARGQLDYARAQAELARLDANKKGKELFEVVNKLTEHNITTTDLREILDVLYNGLKALGELREEWTKLTLYFHDIKSRIDITLGKPLDKFIESASGQFKRINLGNPVSKYAADTLWRLAYETTNTAYLINDEAKTYTDVSRSSFLPMISLLGQLIALDPERDSQKIQSKRGEMEIMTKEMLEDITKKLNDNRNKKVDALQARQEELDETFNKDILKEWLAESQGPGERRQKVRQADELKRNARAVAEETKHDMAADNYGEGFDTVAFLNLGK